MMADAVSFILQEHEPQRFFFLVFALADFFTTFLAAGFA